jgi:DNA-binding NtrC family response regulator
MTVMVIDDDDIVLESLKHALSLNGFRVSTFLSPRQALYQYEADQDKYDIVISDFHLPGMNGIELMKEILKKNPGVPVIIISGNEDRELLPKSMKMGACAFFYKPLDINQLIDKLYELGGVEN